VELTRFGGVVSSGSNFGSWLLVFLLQLTTLAATARTLEIEILANSALEVDFAVSMTRVM
jgi:hypothetical protein